MTEYTVYFELFGKKMKTKVLADNEQQAKQSIYNRIIFHAIIPEQVKAAADQDIFDLLGVKR